MGKLDYQLKGLCYITGESCPKEFKCEDCELEKKEYELAQEWINFFD